MRLFMQLKIIGIGSETAEITKKPFSMISTNIIKYLFTISVVRSQKDVIRLETKKSDIIQGYMRNV